MPWSINQFSSAFTIWGSRYLNWPKLNATTDHPTLLFLFRSMKSRSCCTRRSMRTTPCSAKSSSSPTRTSRWCLRSRLPRCSTPPIMEQRPRLRRPPAQCWVLRPTVFRMATALWPPTMPLSTSTWICSLWWVATRTCSRLLERRHLPRPLAHSRANLSLCQPLWACLRPTWASQAPRLCPALPIWLLLNCPQRALTWPQQRLRVAIISRRTPRWTIYCRPSQRCSRAAMARLEVAQARTRPATRLLMHQPRRPLVHLSKSEEILLLPCSNRRLEIRTLRLQEQLTPLQFCSCKRCLAKKCSQARMQHSINSPLDVLPSPKTPSQTCYSRPRRLRKLSVATYWPPQIACSTWVISERVWAAALPLQIQATAWVDRQLPPNQ